MSKVFFVDVAHCVGCYNCQLACKDEHVGNDWAPYARPQPPTGHFWMKVTDHVCGTIPKVKIHYIAQPCAHCENPACLAAAKDGAVYQRPDGLVIIDPEKAVGQKQLVSSCPYGAIYWNEKLNLPQKCTGCAHLTDNGEKIPRCVDACPTDALMFGEYDELREKIEASGAKRLESRNGCVPGIFYAGIPGRFVAGTVYDPDEKEVIIGATVTLTDFKGDTVRTMTDDFGDFWLKDVPAEKVLYLSIAYPGYETVKFKVATDKADVNLNDIPLKKRKL